MNHVEDMRVTFRRRNRAHPFAQPRAVKESPRSLRLERRIQYGFRALCHFPTLLLYPGGSTVWVQAAKPAPMHTATYTDYIAVYNQHVKWHFSAASKRPFGPLELPSDAGWCFGVASTCLIGLPCWHTCDADTNPPVPIPATCRPQPRALPEQWVDSSHMQHSVRSRICHRHSAP